MFNGCADDDVEEGECGAETWQRVHPSCWSNGDVLDVIFYVARKSFHGLHAVHNVRGEKFQGVRGGDLYRMTRQDFRERDSIYGDLLFDCIQDLLEQSKPGSSLGVGTNFSFVGHWAYLPFLSPFLFLPLFLHFLPFSPPSVRSRPSYPPFQWRRLHGAREGTCPHFYKWLGTGGGTVSRRTANKKLTELY